MKRAKTFDEKLLTIREEHTEMLGRAIIQLECDWTNLTLGELDSQYRMRIHQIATDAIRQVTGATAAAYVLEYERKDAEKAQAKQDRNMKLFNRPGRWGQE
jgi:hypothetical protein